MREPFVQDSDFRLYQGDCLEVLREMESNSVDMVCTSPPYYNLRDYRTGSWEGGDENCSHSSGRGTKQTKHPNADNYPAGAAHRGGNPNECERCGAIRVDQQLGLESTPGEYVNRLVEVFKEVRRVLVDTGTVFLNLGDTYSDKQLLGIPWKVVFGLQDNEWIIRSDIVWCLSAGTRLYARTQKGDMPSSLKDLVRLNPSTVKLWNGSKWTQVLGWHRSEYRGEPPMIELASGERIGCTEEHIWPTQRGNVPARELVIGDVIQTTSLPEPEIPREPRFLPDEEIGWLVGLYLAEGSMSNNTVQLSCHAKEAVEIYNRASPVALALHGSAALHYTHDNCATVNLHGPLCGPLMKTYIYGTDAKSKGLQPRVWMRSNIFLHALLMGYLWGDGCYDEKNDRWRLGFAKNDRLAVDLRTLAARLGLPIRLTRATTTGFGKKWPIYRGQIRLNHTTHHNARENGKIVAIGRSSAGIFWDVEVEDAPNLFSLASGVLTHNSKPNAMPSSATDRPTNSHEYVFLLTKKSQYYFDQDAVREPYTEPLARWGGEKVRDHQQWQSPRGLDRDRDLRPNPDGRNIRSVWNVATENFSESHFAVMPQEIVRRCILAGCPEGGTVLDPFGGSGTTALVSRNHNRKSILIELNEEFCQMSARRLRQLSLLTELS